MIHRLSKTHRKKVTHISYRHKNVRMKIFFNHKEGGLKLSVKNLMKLLVFLVKIGKESLYILEIAQVLRLEAMPKSSILNKNLLTRLM